MGVQANSGSRFLTPELLVLTEVEQRKVPHRALFGK
jgi:hypothetical protein